MRSTGNSLYDIYDELRMREHSLMYRGKTGMLKLVIMMLTNIVASIGPRLAGGGINTEHRAHG